MSGEGALQQGFRGRSCSLSHLPGVRHDHLHLSALLTLAGGRFLALTVTEAAADQSAGGHSIHGAQLAGARGHFLYSLGYPPELGLLQIEAVAPWEVKLWASVAPPLPHAPLSIPRQFTLFLLFRALGEFLPSDSRQVKDSFCTRCPLVATGVRLVCGPWLALPVLLAQVFLWALLTPLPAHLFPCGLLVISIPSLHLIGDFAPPHSPLLKTLSPPSSQLYHRPVISFCVDPYICISSPGEGVPLTYNRFRAQESGWEWG